MQLQMGATARELRAVRLQFSENCYDENVRLCLCFGSQQERAQEGLPMGFRFHRNFRVLRNTRTTVGIPGPGISYTGTHVVDRRRPSGPPQKSGWLGLFVTLLLLAAIMLGTVLSA